MCHLSYYRLYRNGYMTERKVTGKERTQRVLVFANRLPVVPIPNWCLVPSKTTE